MDRLWTVEIQMLTSMWADVEGATLLGLDGATPPTALTLIIHVHALGRTLENEDYDAGCLVPVLCVVNQYLFLHQVSQFCSDINKASVREKQASHEHHCKSS